MAAKKKVKPTQVNPVLLVVLDGWGIRNSKRHNAIKTAKTPMMDHLWKMYPHAELDASEEVVGLPSGYIGNSEVGHTHIGCGRLIRQELLHINHTIRDGSFFKNKVLIKTMAHARKNHSSLHIMGLVSDGGVHSHIDHLFALLKMAKAQNVKRVFIHCFMDGRDKPPKSGLKYIKQVMKFTQKHKIGAIATIMGRFYAMDRDNRWNREHKAYDAIVNCVGITEEDPISAVKNAYKRGETDEFIKPIVMKHYAQVWSFEAHDSIIHFNFRSDRARELSRAFVQGKFNKFKRRKMMDLNFASLVQYDAKIRCAVAFPPTVPKNTIGEIIWKAGLKQYRAAETEKYAHVTYFLNGGRESPFPKEDRCVIPSPKVRTYDLKPEMSAYKLTDHLVDVLGKRKYPLVVVNFANADMVGHSGMFQAAVKACEAIDGCLSRVIPAARDHGYDIVITADHGNAEEMTGNHQTSHTLNKVPLIVVSDRVKRLKNTKGASLQQVTPTVLALMGIPRPKELTEPLI